MSSASVIGATFTGDRRDRGDVLVALGLFLFAALLFLVNLGEPPEISFDEFWYVPASRDILHLQKDSNLEHPLFAKQIIGLGIWIFGDNAFGWRFFGALLGASIPASLFVICRYFGLKRTMAAFGALLMIFDQTLFVMSRTAMLDIHAMGLLAISCVALAWSAQPKRSFRGAVLGLVAAAVIYGLACGAKWLAIFNGALLWMGILAAVFLERRTAGASRTIWPRLPVLAVLAIFGAVTLVVYLCTFWPLFFLEQGKKDFIGVLETQLRIFRRSSAPLGHHAHQSDWWSWPAMIEPVWFYLSKPVDGIRQGVFYVGNMAVYWTGALAGIGCAILGMRRLDRGLLALGATWLAMWLIWAVVPKKIGFFYYYDAASILLGPCIAALFQAVIPLRYRTPALITFGVVTLAIFAYFYPILAASGITPNEWRRFVLFPGWA